MKWSVAAYRISNMRQNIWRTDRSVKVGERVMVVDLLRHGELQGGIRYRGHVEGDLTDAGRIQMNAVWQKVNADVDVIFTSPLSRCAVVSHAWAQEKGIPCIVDERIIEMHYGAWEGMSHDEIETAFPNQLTAWRQDPTGMRPPQGESPEELLERIRDFWAMLTAAYQGQHVLVVGHSGSMRMLIAHIQNQPIAYTRDIPMPYACWHRVKHEQGMNIVEHMDV